MGFSLSFGSTISDGVKAIGTAVRSLRAAASLPVSVSLSGLSSRQALDGAKLGGWAGNSLGLGSGIPRGSDPSNPSPFSGVIPDNILWYRQNGYLDAFRRKTSADSPESYFTCMAYYAGVRTLAGDLSSCPISLVRHKPGTIARPGTTVVEKFRARHGFMSGLAHPDMSVAEFVEALTAQAVVWGNGYALKVWESGEVPGVSGFGGRLWLYPLDPGQVCVELDRNGRNVYVVKGMGGITGLKGTERRYAPAEIFHLKGFTLNGSAGDYVPSRVREALQLYMQQQEYALDYFLADATPRTVVERDNTVDAMKAEEVENFKRLWVASHSGSKGEPAILQEGMKVKVLEVNHQNAQLVEQRDHQLQEVARAVPIPGFKIGLHANNDKATVEQLAKEYVSGYIHHWRERWKSAFHRCLLTDGERAEGELELCMDTRHLEEPDAASRSESFARLLEKGGYTPNEVRESLGLNPREGGDTLLVQLNMAALKDVVEGAGFARQDAGNNNTKPETKPGASSLTGK